MGKKVRDYQSDLRAVLLRALQLARQRGPLFAPVILSESCPGFTARLAIEAATSTSSLPALVLADDCRLAIVTVLQAANGSPITTSGIVAVLEPDGYSEPTLKRRLAELVKAGVLTASRKAPRGYRLASGLSLPAQP